MSGPAGPRPRAAPDRRSLAPETLSPAESLARGRESGRRQAWADACAQLSAADAAIPLEGPDLELLATAATMVGDDELSLAAWTRAHAECVRRDDLPGAARCAFWLILDLLNRGEAAQANGWLGRAQRLLDEAACDCAERGMLLVLAARLQARSGELASAEAAAMRALELGNRFGDAELKAFGRLMLGQILVRRGELGAAGALFDEVMVAVTVGDVAPVGIGVIYCAVIDVCRQAFDLARAREWTAALARWCNAQPDLVAFRGQCLVHRAEVMRVSGDWSGALAEAEHAGELLAPERRGLEPDAVTPPGKYPLGAAWYEVAEIHRLRGEFEAAHEAYRRASVHGQQVEPGLALLRLAEGQPELAEAAIRRAMEQPQPRFTRALVLAAGVEIMIAVRDVGSARAALEELLELSARLPTPYLQALASRAHGSVLLAEGAARAALAPLRAAWATWQELEAPYEAARVRVLLGLACRELGDRDAAELELEAARRVFERLQASPDLVRLKQPPAAGGDSPLTERERQVLALVASGRTNRAIAGELGISERTVDRHVSNILLKLGLHTRSAATAYAFQHGLFPPA